MGIGDWLREKSGFNAAKAATDEKLKKKVDKATGDDQKQAPPPPPPPKKEVEPGADPSTGIKFANGGSVSKSKRPQYR